MPVPDFRRFTLSVHDLAIAPPKQSRFISEVNNFTFKYSDDQPRDDHGRWTGGGSLGDSMSAETTAGLAGSKLLYSYGNDSVSSLPGFAGPEAAKFRNMQEIGNSLVDQAASNEKLASQLDKIGGNRDHKDAVNSRFIEGVQPAPMYPPDLTARQIGAYYAADQLQQAWASSSSDHDALSIAVQEAVAEKFGLDLGSMPWRHRISLP